MIENIYNNATLPSGTAYSKAEFFGVEHLVCYRTLPFAFNLVATSNEVGAKDVRLFTNPDTSKSGCKDLITAMRDFAISHTEIWTTAQLQAVSGTQTLFIIYNSEADCYLNFSKELLTLENLQEANQDAQIFVSYDISDAGLINLVNELLNFL